MANNDLSNLSQDRQGSNCYMGLSRPKKIAVFLTVAVFAGVISSAVLYFLVGDNKANGSLKGKTIHISREATEQILAADSNMQREVAAQRQKEIALQNAEGRLHWSALGLGEIVYGMSEDEVIKLCGRPIKIEHERDIRYAGQDVVEYNYDDMEVHIVNGTVRGIKATDKSSQLTVAGIGVGMELGLLLATYGKPSLTLDENYIYFLEGDPTIGITFEIEQGRINDIKVGDLGL